MGALVDIAGYGGLYKISDEGVVISFHKRHFNKPLKPSVNEKGYLTVALQDKSWKKYRINRLVAMTFINNPDNKPEVNHRDGNKLNNYASNLEWSTHGENQKHAHLLGLKPNIGIYNRKLDKKVVLDIFNNKSLTVSELGRMYNISRTSIRMIKNRVSYKEVTGISV